MKLYSLLRTLAILALVFFNTYAIADGLQYKSYWGVALAVGSLIALAACIYLFKKLQQLNAGE
jgi:hypothetical protein